jgi:protein SCO1
MMNIRWLAIALAILIGVTLMFLTRPRRDEALTAALSKMKSAAAEKAGKATDDDDAGEAVAESPFGNDPGQRKAIESMQKGLVELTEEQWMRAYELTERSGKTIGTADLKGQPYIASFFFSRCPGSCKQQNDQMRLLQQKYRNAPIRLVSISVDPEADTPEVLELYADSYGADKNKWLFFTGDINYIAKVAGEVFMLGQIREKSHPDRFCLVDGTGKLVGKYNWHEPKELALLDEHVKEILSATEKD